MLNDIIKKFQKADILVNYNAYSEIQGNDEYDYLIDELIEYVENNGDNEYIITTQTIRNYQMRERQEN